MIAFSKVDSCSMCPTRLYVARSWAERAGKTAEQNALERIISNTSWRDRVRAEATKELELV